uniref:T-cell surface glycoprotein CD3 epsilon chain n=1 Tax=Tupaia belangeri TaxID=37347 RepID=D6QT12_TUPBE|nr:CD3 epsilon chain [Tupaia belangeri]
MQSGTLRRVLGLCFLVVGAWGEDDNDKTGDSKPASYKVSISGISVTLTCPLESDITWEKNGKEIPDDHEKVLVLDNFSEIEDSGYYTCFTNEEKNHNLYLKARVCKNCMEVDLMTVATVVVIDIGLTLGLLLLVYYWSKSKKAKAKPVTRGAGAGGRPRGQKKERPPPVPNPDYEPIRKGQRDLYAGLNQRGI